jgi:transposase
MCDKEHTEAVRTGAAVFVAMELSRSTWILAAQASPSGKTSSHRLEGGDADGLLALLRRLAAREQGRPERTCRSSSATRPATTASGCTVA